MNTLSSAEATVNKQPTTVVLPGLQNFGQAVLADYCGDMVLYRSLKPIDSRLPKIRRAMFEAGLAGDNIPRKQDVDYAKVATVYAQAIHRLSGQNGEPTELLFIGDTLYNDGGAFRNMAAQRDWRGACFIGVEEADEEPAICCRKTFIEPIVGQPWPNGPDGCVKIRVSSSIITPLSWSTSTRQRWAPVVAMTRPSTLLGLRALTAPLEGVGRNC